MAVVLPYKRDHVYAWIVEFFEQDEVESLREWLTDKLGNDADMVIRGRTLIDMLMEDTGTYVLDLRNANRG
jgi:hypothetical protein